MPMCVCLCGKNVSGFHYQWGAPYFSFTIDLVSKSKDLKDEEREEGIIPVTPLVSHLVPVVERLDSVSLCELHRLEVQPSFSLSHVRTVN